MNQKRNDRLRKKRVLAKNYFSIIELLIVIAIIAILISLLLPSLRRVQEKAIGTVCMGGPVKTIGLMLSMYACDFNDWIPPTCGSSSGGAKWVDAFVAAGYKNAIQPFHCPALKTRPVIDDELDYGVCATNVIAPDNNTHQYGNYIRLNRMKRPSVQIYGGDSWRGRERTKGSYIIRTNASADLPAEGWDSQRIAGRHGGFAACVMFGGNAQLIAILNELRPGDYPPFRKKLPGTSTKDPEYIKRLTNQ